MNRRELIALVAGAVVALPARAQQAGKLRRVGFLRVGTPPLSFIDPFKKGLRELGHVEGPDFVIDYGLAKSAAQLPQLAAELVLRKIDVLVASGTPSVMPAKNASATIPVVFIAAIDPVAAGIAASLGRPGGTVTGVSAVHADVTGKRLQLLKELIPRLATIAILVHSTSPATHQYVQEAEAAARTLGLRLQVVGVREASDLEGALGSAKSAGALVTVDDAVFTAQRVTIAELALKNRLATISGLRETVDAGGLFSYGPHYGDLYLRAARHVHEILEGAKPGDLSIEQPTKFEMVINLKTAKALELTVPPSLLARADEVIE